MQLSSAAETALPALLRALDARGYDFVAPTPATHARVLARPDRDEARDLRDVFGWSLAFAQELLPEEIHSALAEADALEPADGNRLKSKLRVSRLCGILFLHSAYPTVAENAVFLGPDSYRFARFLRSELKGFRARRLVDLGAGGGVGAIAAAAVLPGARLTLVDVNPVALRLAAINAAYAGLEVETIEGSGMGAVDGAVDLVIANPPYIVDECNRAYRNGGGMHGAQISLDWALAAAERLDAGGRMLLYTGAAIVGGRDELREALARDLPPLGCTLRYEELDPDVFGEELEKEVYRDAERIAAVGAIIEKQARGG